MSEPILSRAQIVTSARTAANDGQDIHIANPHPAGTAAHALWELSYRIAVGEGEGHFSTSVC